MAEDRKKHKLEDRKRHREEIEARKEEIKRRIGVSDNFPCKFHYELLQLFDERVEIIEDKLDTISKITVKNGDGKEYKIELTDLILILYDATIMLRDFAKVHGIFKRYKLYYILPIIFLLFISIQNKLEEIFQKIFSIFIKYFL